MLRRAALAIAGALALSLLGLVLSGVTPLDNLRIPPRAANGVDYVLYVHAPRACTEATPCPAVYLLDGERWFGRLERVAAQAAREGRMRPVVIVGIGYRDIFGTRSRRKLDFTPVYSSSGVATGGADAYLRTLQQEIIPYVEERLPIDASERALVGHSYAGLLSVHAMRATPDLFDRYLIVSPALWFDAYGVFDADTPQATDIVFLAADTPREASSEMVRDAQRLAALMGEGDDRVTLRIFEGTTHDSVVRPALEAGLPLLFPATASP